MAAKCSIDCVFSSSRAPPPSPIPTGKGSRSAADADPALSLYIDKSNQIVPELILPEHAHRLAPPEIEYGLLRVRDKDAVDRLVRSATQLGAVRISGHGISTQGLRSALVENEAIFGLSTHFVWCPSDKAMLDSVKEILGELQFQNFSQKMKKAARELEAIAKEIEQVMLWPSGNDKQAQREIQSSIPCLTLHAYYNEEIPRPLDAQSHQDSSPYAFSLNLLLEPPATILVTPGEQLQEYWSPGELKSAKSELILRPNFRHHHHASFSVELKWSFSSNLNNNNNSFIIIDDEAKKGLISLSDQLFFLIIVALLFNLFASLHA